MEALVFVTAILAIVAIHRKFDVYLEANQSLSRFLQLSVRDYVLIGAVFLCALILYGPILVRIPGDQRLLQAFSPDFSNQAALVQNMVNRGSFDLNIPAWLSGEQGINHWNFSYGALHINLSILTARILTLVHPVDYGVIAKIHAAWLLLGLLMSQGLLYIWGRNLGGRLVAVIACLVYLLPYKMLFLLVHACSPDHIQQALMMATLTGCALLSGKFTFHRLFWISLLAGLVFGTKYLGIFLLPLIMLSAYLGGALQQEGIFGKALALTCGSIGIGFLLGFTVSNPQVILHPVYFFQRMTEISRLLNYGYFFSDGVWQAYWQLFYERFMASDAILVALVTMGGVLLIRAAWRAYGGLAFSVAPVVAGWGLFYSAVLLGLLRYAEPGVFVPLWPALTLGVALSIAKIGQWLSKAFYCSGARLSSYFALILCGILLAHEAVQPKAAFAPVRSDRPLLFNLDHSFFDGLRNLSNFLIEHYPPETTILVDYSQLWVPASFHAVNYAYFLTLALAEEQGEVPPDVEVMILTRTDADFEHDFTQGYYPHDKVSLARNFYRNIRTGGVFVKQAEFDYPSSWLTGRAEVWVRRPKG